MGTFWRDVEALRREAPLVHNITNYVVMNFTANALLAAGASPVMAHAREEVEEMAALAASLVINIGTLEPDWVAAMMLAGHAARQHGRPVLLDPVGAGATAYRTRTAREIVEELQPDVIRGNVSELLALAGATGVSTRGVDSLHGLDGSSRAQLGEFARMSGCVVSASGEVDFITDGRREFHVPFGAALMARVTGMGCAASALTGAFLAVNTDPFVAASHGMMLMGMAGEHALAKSRGPGSFPSAFLDVLYHWSRDDVARFESRLSAANPGLA